MSEATPIDTAHAAMEAAPEDGALRLRFYERISDSELFLMLDLLVLRSGFSGVLVFILRSKVLID